MLPLAASIPTLAASMPALAATMPALAATMPASIGRPSGAAVARPLDARARAILHLRQSGVNVHESDMSGMENFTIDQLRSIAKGEGPRSPPPSPPPKPTLNDRVNKSRSETQFMLGRVDLLLKSMGRTQDTWARTQSKVDRVHAVTMNRTFNPTVQRNLEYGARTQVVLAEIEAAADPAAARAKRDMFAAAIGIDMPAKGSHGVVPKLSHGALSIYPQKMRSNEHALQLLARALEPVPSLFRESPVSTPAELRQQQGFAEFAKDFVRSGHSRASAADFVVVQPIDFEPAADASLALALALAEQAVRALLGLPVHRLGSVRSARLGLRRKSKQALDSQELLRALALALSVDSSPAARRAGSVFPPEGLQGRERRSGSLAAGLAGTRLPAVPASAFAVVAAEVLARGGGGAAGAAAAAAAAAASEPASPAAHPSVTQTRFGAEPFLTLGVCAHGLLERAGREALFAAEPRAMHGRATALLALPPDLGSAVPAERQAAAHQLVLCVLQAVCRALGILPCCLYECANNPPALTRRMQGPARAAAAAGGASPLPGPALSPALARSATQQLRTPAQSPGPRRLPDSPGTPAAAPTPSPSLSLSLSMPLPGRPRTAPAAALVPAQLAALRGAGRTPLAGSAAPVSASPGPSGGAAGQGQSPGPGLAGAEAGSLWSPVRARLGLTRAQLTPLRLCPVCLHKLLWAVECSPAEHCELQRDLFARWAELPQAERAWAAVRCEKLVDAPLRAPEPELHGGQPRAQPQPASTAAAAAAASASRAGGAGGAGASSPLAGGGGGGGGGGSGSGLQPSADGAFATPARGAGLGGCGPAGSGRGAEAGAALLLWPLGPSPGPSPGLSLSLSQGQAPLAPISPRSAAHPLASASSASSPALTAPRPAQLPLHGGSPLARSAAALQPQAQLSPAERAEPSGRARGVRSALSPGLGVELEAMERLAVGAALASPARGSSPALSPARGMAGSPARRRTGFTPEDALALERTHVVRLGG